MSLTTPIRQARFQTLAVMVWGSYLQTPWLLKFHLVSLEYMVIAPKAHSRDWMLGQDVFLTFILTALAFLTDALVLLAVDLACFWGVQKSFVALWDHPGHQNRSNHVKSQGRCRLAVIRSTSLIGHSWSPVNVSLSLSPSQPHTSDGIILSHVPCPVCYIPPGQWAVTCLNSNV